jgi:hypothetical protein
VQEQGGMIGERSCGLLLHRRRGSRYAHFRADNIEYNVQTIATHTGAADRELVSAHEYQRKAGKRAACLLAVVGFVVAIVLIAVSLPGCIGPPSNTLTRPRAGSELMPGSALHTALPAIRLHTWSVALPLRVTRVLPPPARPRRAYTAARRQAEFHLSLRDRVRGNRPGDVRGRQAKRRDATRRERRASRAHVG